jgi:hypothetical protein
VSAEPILILIAKLLRKHGLEAILIGNAAAALHGAPVTTVDLDFLIRPTRGNREKLKALGRDLDAMLLRPFYPVSSLIRLQRDADTLQLDFMTAIHGANSFDGIRSRAVKAALTDSKPAKRLPAKQRSLKQRKPRRKQVLDAFKKGK